MIAAGGLQWAGTTCGDGPVIVLLHGTGGTRRTWDAMIPFLAPSFRVLAIDLPGHGETGYPGFARLTLEGMSSLVREAIAAVEADPRAIVGHSAGAAIMLQLAADGSLATDVHLFGINAALEPPADIARAIMQSPVGDVFRSGAARSLVRAAGRISPFIELLLATTGSRLTRDQENDYLSAFASGDHAEAAYAMVANWDLVPLRRALPTIPQQTTLIVGSNDPWIPPRVSREGAMLMSHATFRSVTGGHLVHEENPREVAELIADALAKHG